MQKEDGSPLADNFRPVQDMNGRTVHWKRGKGRVKGKAKGKGNGEDKCNGKGM